MIIVFKRQFALFSRRCRKEGEKDSIAKDFKPRNITTNNIRRQQHKTTTNNIKQSGNNQDKDNIKQHKRTNERTAGNQEVESTTIYLSIYPYLSGSETKEKFEQATATTTTKPTKASREQSDPTKANNYCRNSRTLEDTREYKRRKG